MRLGGLLAGKGKYVAFGLLGLLALGGKGGKAAPKTVPKPGKRTGKRKSNAEQSYDSVVSWLDKMRSAHNLYPNVPIPVAATIMSIESGGIPTKVNRSSGAAGLMQLLPGPDNSYWKQYGLSASNVLDPWLNIETGFQMLSEKIADASKRWPATSSHTLLDYVIGAYHDGSGGMDSTYPGLSGGAAKYLSMYKEAAPVYQNLA